MTASRPSLLESTAARAESDVRRETRTGQRIGRAVLYALLILLALVCVLPFYSMIVASSHTNTNIATELLLLPGDAFRANYDRLLDTVFIWRGFWNSIVVAGSATVLSLYFSALAGYGFSKFAFRGRRLLFGFVIGTMMIPGQLGIVGFFKLVSSFHLLNSYWPLILPAIAYGFGIFFLKQICDSSVPNELLEAGRIDGASEIRIFHQLAMPILMPSIATLGIFVFISKWNSFLEPLIIIFDNEKQTLPVMIATTKGQFATDYGAQYVGIALSVVPILIVFSLASRRIIDGVTTGMLKE